MFSNRNKLFVALAMFASLAPIGAAHAGACASVWVNGAVIKALGRAPSGPGAPECNMSLYNPYLAKTPDGSITEQNVDNAVAAYWKAKVSVGGGMYTPTQAAATPAGSLYFLNGKTYTQTQMNSMAGRLPNGGTVYIIDNKSYLIASGGGNIVGPGSGSSFQLSLDILPAGTKLIASGGGNLVASGGGNLIASGGGNFNGAP